MPGDIADNGLPGEYDLVRSALADFRIPVHAIPGDHDLASGSLHSFYAGLGVARLPQAIDVAGRRCLFLDMVSAGRCGPDFRLGASQIAWLERELTRADRGGGSVVFMHTYPAHLADPAERRAIVDAFANHRVIVADIGHTHYNELANDGRVIYAATRSTGQIEEG